MKINYKKYLPYACAIIGFAIITLIFFNPVLKGKVLRQGDMVSYKGMVKSIQDFRKEYHTEPLWTNSMFGGMPAYLISAKKKSDFVQGFYRNIKKVLPYPANNLFFAMICFFILLLVLKIDPLPAAIGSVAYAFASYYFIIIAAGHVTKGFAMAFLPLVVAGFILTFNKKYWKGSVLFMFALGLEICANHLQITYYLLIILIVLGIVYFIKYLKNKELKLFFKPVILLVIATFLAILPSATNILTLHQFTKYTIRGKSNLTAAKAKNEAKNGLTTDYITQWSYGIDETFSLMIPDVNGGATGAIGQNHSKALDKADPQFRQYIAQMDEYWGNQPFTAGPIYFGAVIMFLFFLALFLLKGPLKIWLVVCTVLSIMLSWGHNLLWFTNLFIHYVPLYNKFRTVTMILVIAQFCVPILAVLVLKKIVDDTDYIRKNIKKFYWGTIIAAGICLLYIVAPGIFTDFFKDNGYQRLTSQLRQSHLSPDQISLFLGDLTAARKSILTSDAFRSLIYILISAALVWAYIKNKLKKQYLLAGLLILVTVDLWSVGKRYLNKDNYESKREAKHPFQPTPADLQIMQDKTPDYRVLNLSVSTYNDASTSYFHQSVGGYSAAKLMRYQELIDHDLSQPKINPKVLNMLNTKYIIVPDKNKQPQAQLNPGALGNVWFVQNYKLEPNADSAINALQHFDPSKTAIINQKFKKDLSGFQPNNNDSSASIKLSSFKLNDLIYQYQSTKPQLAVFSEIYYAKGWHAYIDGKKAPYFLANYVLRAMVVPAGNHKIEFKFHPKIYYLGEKLGYLGSFLFFGIIIAFFVYTFQQKKKQEKAENATISDEV